MNKETLERKVVMPTQPVYTDESGTIRFVPNRIVEKILENSVFDMNSIAKLDVTDQERIQLAQLIGYSVSGFASLSYATEEAYEIARRMNQEGVSQLQAENDYLRGKLNAVKEGMKEVVADLYEIHPDDLET